MEMITNVDALIILMKRQLKNEHGIIDEVAMRIVFDALNISLTDRLLVWHTITART